VKDCVGALLESLSHEENRPAMDIAQGRSIKFVRPTDDCDVCEGGGIDFSHERFKRVRSAVRENALWSLVILCSHGTAVLGETFEAIVTAMRKIIREEENVICVGLALDVLNRLANLPGNESSPQLDDLRSNLMDILAEPPVRGWEALVRGGLSVEALSRFATS